MEVFFKVKKKFFQNKKKITEKNISSIVSHMGSCIEIVGYRQKKKGLTYLGDLISDFGANVKFLVGQKKNLKKYVLIICRQLFTTKKVGRLTDFLLVKIKCFNL